MSPTTANSLHFTFIVTPKQSAPRSYKALLLFNSQKERASRGGTSHWWTLSAGDPFHSASECPGAQAHLWKGWWDSDHFPANEPLFTPSDTMISVLTLWHSSCKQTTCPSTGERGNKLWDFVQRNTIIMDELYQQNNEWKYQDTKW